MIARETPARARLARAGSRTFAALASCCVLGLACIPSATAKRSSETSAATGSAQTSTQPSSTPEAAGSTQAAPTTPAKHHDGGAHSRQTSGSGDTPGDTSSTSATGGEDTGTTKTPPSGTRRSGPAREAQHARSRPGHSKRSRTAAGEPAAGEQSEEAQGEAEAGGQSQSASALARPAASHKKTGKGKKKEGAGGSGKHKKDKSGQEQEKEPESNPGETSGTPAPSPTLSAGPPAEALVPAPAPAPVAVAPAPAPTPGAGIAKPSHVAHRAHRARARHRASTRAAASPLAPAAGASAGLAGAAIGKHARRPRHVQGSPHGGGSGGPVAPLVRSITKIVEVVPVAVRVLIAALLALALGLGLRSWLSTLRARRLERQRSELLDDVGLLQAALLPATPAHVGPVQTSAAYQPAAGPGAGGDFYDVFELADGQLAVIVGDISGHGRQALPHTALVRFTLRAYLEAGLSPRNALQTAGVVLERQLGGVFATVVVAIYDPGERVLVYACAGHPPPLLIGASPGAHSLSALTVCTSPPIGVGMRTGTRQTSVALPGRTQVCFYTDGVTEARIDHELFGPERLQDALIELGPGASASAVLGHVAEEVDARPDDMAACVLSVPGGRGTPSVITEELELDRAEASSTRTVSFLRACGVAESELAEVLRSASSAAGRAGTVVLEVRRRGQGAAEVSLRREQLAYLHARRAEMEQTNEAEVAQ